MRKLVTLMCVLVFSIHNSQVGIGTTELHEAEVLRIASKLPNETGYRGLLLPRVALTGDNDVTTIPDPSHALTIYRTDGLRGFYYWDDSVGGKVWRRAYDKPGVLGLVVPIKNATKESGVNGAQQASGLGGAEMYNIEEQHTVRNWELIDGMQENLFIRSAVNNVTVTASGVVQLNNSNQGQSNQTHSFAIGIFIDGKLKSVRTYLLEGHKEITCMIKSFDIKTNIPNLPVKPNPNIPYVVEVYVISRTDASGNGTQLNWAKPSSSCTNQNAFMTKASLSVQSQQF